MIDFAEYYRLTKLLIEYLEEIDALIDADDGDVFDGAFLRKHDALKETVDEIVSR